MRGVVLHIIHDTALANSAARDALGLVLGQCQEFCRAALGEQLATRTWPFREFALAVAGLVKVLRRVGGHDGLVERLDYSGFWRATAAGGAR
jgi:hypothetical protein